MNKRFIYNLGVVGFELVFTDDINGCLPVGSRWQWHIPFNLIRLDFKNRKFYFSDLIHPVQPRPSLPDPLHSKKGAYLWYRPVNSKDKKSLDRWRDENPREVNPGLLFWLSPKMYEAPLDEVICFFSRIWTWKKILPASSFLLKVDIPKNPIFQVATTKYKLI